MVNKKDILDSGKLTPEQLDAEIKLWMTDGKDVETEPGKTERVTARTEQSALNKIIREISTEEVGKEDISGFFLETYKPLRKEGTSCYILHPTDGPLKVEISSIPKKGLGAKPQVKNPIVVKNTTRFRNVFAEDSKTWLEANPKSVIEPTKLDVPFERCVQPINAITGSGLYVCSGAIRFVNEKAEFVEDADGKRVPEKRLPVLDQGGKVNLRLVVEDNTGRVSVGIPDVARLKLLIGEDIEWLLADGAVKELSDMLRGYQVDVFGRASKYFSEGKSDQKEVNPFFNLGYFGWVLIRPGQG